MCRVNPRACDHLDVLSHEAILIDLLHMAAGKASGLTDHIVSDIDAIVGNMSPQSAPGLAADNSCRE